MDKSFSRRLTCSSSLLARLRTNSSDNSKFKWLVRRRETKCKTAIQELLVVEAEVVVLRTTIWICKLDVL
jgi:hypothetical protein